MLSCCTLHCRVVVRLVCYLLWSCLFPFSRCSFSVSFYRFLCLSPVLQPGINRESRFPIDFECILRKVIIQAKTTATLKHRRFIPARHLVLPFEKLNKPNQNKTEQNKTEQKEQRKKKKNVTCEIEDLVENHLRKLRTSLAVLVKTAWC